MSLMADSGAIYAIYDADDAHHKAVCEIIDQEKSTIIIPDIILVEIVYLLREFLSIDAELDFMNDLIRGSYKLEPLNMNDFKRCQELIEKYRNLDLGLADSAVIAIKPFHYLCNV